MATIKLDLEDITTNYSRYKVEEPVSNLKSWSDVMMRLRKELSAMKLTIEGHVIEELREEVGRLSRSVEKTGTEFDSAKDQIRAADKTRASTVIVRPSPLLSNYPHVRATKVRIFWNFWRSFQRP